MKLMLLYLLVLAGPPFMSFVLCTVTLLVVRSARITLPQRLGIAGLYAGARFALVFVDIATVFFRSAPDTAFQLMVNGLRVAVVFYVAKSHLRLKWSDVALSVLILGVLDSSWVTSFWMTAVGKFLAK